MSIGAFAWRVAILEEAVKEAGLVEMMEKMDTMTEDLTAVLGKWNEASVKLVTQDKKLEDVRVQLLRKI